MTRFNAAFHAWFGRSKVVNPDGSPRVVYHGTWSSFESFKRTGSKGGPRTITLYLFDDNGMGFFFDAHPGFPPDLAGSWGGAAGFAGTYQQGGMPYTRPGSRTIPVYLSLQNPLVIDSAKYVEFIVAKNGGRYAAVWLKRSGYDGVIRTHFGKPWHFVALYPTQIKSVYNTGTWDPEDPDIRRNPGGLTPQYLYHATPAGNLANIAQNDLQPSQDPHWGGYLGDQSMNRVFASRTPKQALYYGKLLVWRGMMNDSRADFPLLLLIKTSPSQHWQRDRSTRQDYFTGQTIPPNRIQVRWQDSWYSLPWAAAKLGDLTYRRTDEGIEDFEGDIVGRADLHAVADVGKTYTSWGIVNPHKTNPWHSELPPTAMARDKLVLSWLREYWEVSNGWHMTRDQSPTNAEHYRRRMYRALDALNMFKMLRKTKPLLTPEQFIATIWEREEEKQS